MPNLTDPKDPTLIQNLGSDSRVKQLYGAEVAVRYRYTYNFKWLGVPIIQFPDDIAALSEIVWAVKPDLVIETGIAHGGSLIFYASMLELLGGEGRVLGIDIDIREHNRAVIEHHPLARRIDMMQGSSIDPAVVSRAAAMAQGKRVMVVLDSDHTESHVLRNARVFPARI